MPTLLFYKGPKTLRRAGTCFYVDAPTNGVTYLNCPLSVHRVNNVIINISSAFMLFYLSSATGNYYFRFISNKYNDDDYTFFEILFY